MNKRDAYGIGYENGYEAGQYAEFEDGEIPLEACLEAEANARQYSPFELTASEINLAGDRSDELWAAYDRGVLAGIKAGLKDRGIKASKPHQHK